MIHQSEIMSHSQDQLEVHTCIALFASHIKLHKFGAEKTNTLS
jgi:hypothetical protein